MGIDRSLKYYNHQENGPNFHWSHQDRDEVSTTNRIVNKIKEVVNGMITTTDSPTVEVTTLGSTVAQTTTEAVEEMVNSNRTVIDEMIGSNRTIIDEMVANNRTVLDEMVGNNSTGTDGNDDTILETTTNFVTEIMETTISSTQKMIENATEFVSSMVDDGTTTTTEINEIDGNYDWTNDSIEDKTLYIALGVILGALILLSIILIVIYVRYRIAAAKSASRRVYCLTDLNELSTASSENKKLFRNPIIEEEKC